MWIHFCSLHLHIKNCSVSRRKKEREFLYEPLIWYATKNSVHIGVARFNNAYKLTGEWLLSTAEYQSYREEFFVWLTWNKAFESVLFYIIACFSLHRCFTGFSDVKSAQRSQKCITFFLWLEPYMEPNSKKRKNAIEKKIILSIHKISSRSWEIVHKNST